MRAKLEVWMKTGPWRCVFFLALSVVGPAIAQEQLPDILVTPVDEQLTKLWVNGYVNVLVLRCDDSVVLIDAGFEETAEQLASKLGEMGIDRVDYVINTHSDGDHTGGNDVIGRESTIISHASCREALDKEEGFPTTGLPSTTFTDSLRVPCGSGELALIAMPGGHTDNDVVVHLPARKILYLGDIIVPETFPVVWLDHYAGVSVERLAEVLGAIIDLFPNDTRFLSAHGRDYTMEELRTYREMVAATTDLVRNAIADGMTVENMQAENLLRDWASWNSRLYEWVNTDFWIDTVYRSLARPPTRKL
jgi:glyoxylase-like metal-dependent hydrolase (beta-lactamase superfamily II)